MLQIADRLGCTHSAIVYKFKKFGLKSRGHLGLTRPIRLTKKGFKYLYYQRGLSLKKIASIAHCSESGLERRFKKYNLVSRGDKSRTCKYKRRDFSENRIEKAYLIGFRLGDLNVMKSVSVIQVRCSTTIPAQVKLIRELFSLYTTPHITRAKRGTYEIVCLVNRSFDFLLPKKDEIPEWIVNNKELFFSFFAGYSDAEGCFYFKKPGRKGKTKTASYDIQTQQKNIIWQLWKNVQKYGIYTVKPKISVKAGRISSNGNKNNKDMWCLTVSRKDSLWKLINFLHPYIKHRNKIKKISQVEKNIILRHTIPYSHPIDLSRGLFRQ